MKFGFVTCVQLGLSCMEAIYEAGGCLDLAITLHDEHAAMKSGRIFLDEFCRDHSVPLIKVRHVNDENTVNAILRSQIDWLFIIGWSQIAGPNVLAAPARGVVGIHPTLLPEGRGRAAIPWAILKQLRATGVTMFKLAEGVDTGDIIAQKEIALPHDADAAWLYERMNDLHMDLMREALPLLASDQFQLRVQDDSKATYWDGRKPEDGRIDMKGSVFDAERLVRAVTKPYPGAFFDRGGQKITVWRAAIVPEVKPGLLLKFDDGVLECLDYTIVEIKKE